MSREIKFRGWHTKQNKMFSAEEMAVDQMTLLPTGHFINCHSNVKLSTHYPADKFIPLQFTGLHDKNGKEIYEGDIIRNQDRLLEVKWLGCGFVGVGLKGSINRGETNYSLLADGKIIGNIFETPELLEPPLGNNAEPIRNISEDDWRKDDR